MSDQVDKNNGTDAKTMQEQQAWQQHKDFLAREAEKAKVSPPPQEDPASDLCEEIFGLITVVRATHGMIKGKPERMEGFLKRFVEMEEQMFELIKYDASVNNRVSYERVLNAVASMQKGVAPDNPMRDHHNNNRTRQTNQAQPARQKKD